MRKIFDLKLILIELLSSVIKTNGWATSIDRLQSHLSSPKITPYNFHNNSRNEIS